jgi:hypothetical protein
MAADCQLVHSAGPPLVRTFGIVLHRSSGIAHSDIDLCQAAARAAPSADALLGGSPARCLVCHPLPSLPCDTGFMISWIRGLPLPARGLSQMETTHQKASAVWSTIAGQSAMPAIAKNNPA